MDNKHFIQDEKDGARVGMDSILGATFGEANSEIKTSFKKTILIRDYETEVIEVESTLKIDRPMGPVERTLVTAIMQAQIEYESYVQLYKKGLVLQASFLLRRKELEIGVTELIKKYEKLTGKSADEFFCI